MKLTVVGPSFPFKSGISHFTTMLVRHLRTRYEVDFISWHRQYPGFLYPVGQEDTQSRQHLNEENVRLLDFYNPISWIRAALRVRYQKSDRLIVTWVTSVQMPILVVLICTTKLFSKARVTILCHNVLPHHPMFFEAAFTRLVFRLADDFIVHAETEARDLAKIAPGKAVTVGFVPTFDDFNTGQQYDVTTIKHELGLKQNVILFFGFIKPYKGLEWLIKALPQVLEQTDNTTSLLIVGEFYNKNKPEYKQLVEQLGIGQSVVFIDHFVSNEDVGKYFSVTDVMAAPYVSATQSGVVQMAYAFDTPVVATAVGGLPEAVDEGKTGFLCPPADPAALAATLVKALRYDRYDMSVVKARFSWEAYIETTGLNR